MGTTLISHDGAIRAVPLSSHYRWLAERVRDGHRETPQRFRPLAWRLAREPGDAGRIRSLYCWILRYLLAEFREDHGRPAHLGSLVERARVLIEERVTAEDMAALQADILALAPYRRRRRSIHSHGQVASDRVLLVLRTMLPTLSAIGRGTSWFGADEDGLAYVVAWAVAYYVADYDHDHLVMIGPQVADRFVLIAMWCQGNMPGDGLNGMQGR